MTFHLFDIIIISVIEISYVDSANILFSLSCNLIVLLLLSPPFWCFVCLLVNTLVDLYTSNNNNKIIILIIIKFCKNKLYIPTNTKNITINLMYIGYVANLL